MNSNSDYTICNLDNHTYTSNYSTAESVSNSGGYGPHHGSYSVHNNGIVDTGQLGYGAAAAAAMHHGPGEGLPPPPPSHHHHSTTTAAHHPPPPHLYQGTVLTGSPPPGPAGYPGIHHGSTCMTGPAGHPGMPYGDYYPTPAGVITNGGLDCSTGGYPYPHHDPQGPCIATSGGYGLPNHHHNQGQGSPPQDQTPVATYKWMTVKRNCPKPGKEMFSQFQITFSAI